MPANWIWSKRTLLLLKKCLDYVSVCVRVHKSHMFCNTHAEKKMFFFYTHIGKFKPNVFVFYTVNMIHVTRVTLSHNKLASVPPGIANLINLEILNLSNNHIVDLPVSLSSMPKLRILNVSINRLNQLPRGFGAFPVLEVLDLSYNNLSEHVLPGNFFMMGK